MVRQYGLGVSPSGVTAERVPRHKATGVFNCSVLEQGTSYVFLGRSLTLASNVVQLRTESGQIRAFQAPAFRRGVSDAITCCAMGNRY